MFKKVTIICTALVFLGGSWLVGSGMAQDEKGPEEIVLKTVKDPAKKPRTVTFPHREHQSRLECKTCHHRKGADGKQLPYEEGQKIQKCEECHFTGSGMPSKKDKAKGILKLDTFKDAAHNRCRVCHKSEKKKNPELKKKWKKCLPCHVKKK